MLKSSSWGEWHCKGDSAPHNTPLATGLLPISWGPGRIGQHSSNATSSQDLSRLSYSNILPLPSCAFSWINWRRMVVLRLWTNFSQRRNKTSLLFWTNTSLHSENRAKRVSSNFISRHHQGSGDECHFVSICTKEKTIGCYPDAKYRTPAKFCFPLFNRNFLFSNLTLLQCFEYSVLFYRTKYICIYSSFRKIKITLVRW